MVDVVVILITGEVGVDVLQGDVVVVETVVGVDDSEHAVEHETVVEVLDTDTGGGGGGGGGVRLVLVMHGFVAVEVVPMIVEFHPEGKESCIPGRALTITARPRASTTS